MSEEPIRQRKTPEQSSTLMDNVSAAVTASDHAPAPKRRKHDYRALYQRADQDLVREDLGTFFGPRAAKYLAIYEEMRASNKSSVLAWNWIVFFTGFPWYFYRKMYLMGAVVVFLPPLLSYLFGVTGYGGASAGLGITANSQYVLSGIRRLLKADALGLMDEERRQYLQRAGGVSVIAGVLASLLCAAIFAMAILGIYLKNHKSAPLP
jgi:hypothetical protein